MSSNEPENNENVTGVTKIPQPGGRGALNSGGTPGNKGGGRPREAIRARCRTLFDNHGIKVLKKAIKDAMAEPENTLEAVDVSGNRRRRMDSALKAVDIAGKYGLGEAPTIQDGMAEFIASLSVEYVAEDQREAFVKAVFDGMSQFVG